LHNDLQCGSTGAADKHQPSPLGRFQAVLCDDRHKLAAVLQLSLLELAMCMFVMVVSIQGNPATWKNPQLFTMGNPNSTPDNNKNSIIKGQQDQQQSMTTRRRTGYGHPFECDRVPLDLPGQETYLLNL
jgi:hypothetical protein